VRSCVIFNPTAKGDKARRFRAQLDDIAQHAVLKLTQSAGDATRLAAEAVGEGFDLIVAAGGDGTVNEVLNGIGRAPNGFARAALGVLPLGTVNVFARELRLPRRLQDAWAVLQRGKVATIDVGVVERGGAETSGGELRTLNLEPGIQNPNRRYFAQLAGAGLDARAIELVDWRLKQRIGPLAYVWAGLQALCESKPELTVRAGGIELRGKLVLIGNGRLYGGDFATVPAARLDDGLLDVCVFPQVNGWTLLRCALPLLLAQRLPESVVRRVQSAQFTVSCERAAAIELDGDLAAPLPVTFGVERLKLRVVVP
jgi:diacylglycerol kinase (ATP)